MRRGASRWKRLTVLGALGLDGVVTMTTVTTGTTIPVFVDFLQTSLLPVLREQKPDAILVMDNLSARKNQAVKDAITAAGLTLRYLPRYSPDFTIEPCWLKIKNLRAVAARTVESLRAALDTAAAEVHLRTRKSSGDMMRKLSVTLSHSVLHLLGTSRRRKPSTASQKPL